ncbi:MAG: ATP-dependent helicase [Candidatus Yonathbacteria bacterium]|nr:ATP-dependent helicase [Candidatus Yonathbacteria bacterium]
MALSFEERYAKLNTTQRLAVDTTEGPVLVVAGPGSGKTELLSLRVGNILKQGQVSPHNILCLTFTDSGALNMRERLVDLIGKDAYRVSIFTFHAFCNHIIARYPEYFWSATHFSQANDIARAEILTEIFSSLPHKHPLASFHPEKGFVYLRDTADRIKHIKSYGLNALEYEAVIKELPKEYAKISTILTDWPERLSIKNLEIISTIALSLDALKGTTSLYLARTLKQAMVASEALGKTTPLADWKSEYTVKDEDRLCLKDAYNKEKIFAVAEIYKRYQVACYERALYDYDDMIIEVAHALKRESILRNALEEQYQYIMIDEFQDTNEAQMSLVRAITGNTIHEGRPNVCVVGDDDQAIYKFQGAEISHIIDFRDTTYTDVKTIVLDKNYRSTAPVLNLARTLITQGSGRLENKYKDISKLLSSENKALPQGAITIHSYSSDVEEYAHVARAVREAMDKGAEPNDIAILSRGHRELRAILPYLDREQIPYEYVKKANVFDEPHVKILIDMCAYISSIMKQEGTAEHLLPHFLAHPCFHIDRQELFSFAVEIKEKHQSWTEALIKTELPHIKELGGLLAELAIEGATTPLEHILETFMTKSGFKEFYFSRETIKKSPTTYVSFLASLKTFIESLREWKEGDALFVSDVAPFVQMHIDHDIALISESPFMKDENSVQLMTAHKSKGLEFGTVFIISAHDKLWTRPPRTNIAPLPSPLLPLMQPAGDTEDDFIRLLYVAITRAKHTLHISSHETPVRFLPEGTAHAEKATSVPIEAHENALALSKAPYKENEWVLLKRLIQNYHMPVTHLNNFVNILEGGPLYFLEQNLLRFPQPMNTSGVYGTAMHKAIEEIIMYPKFNAGEKAPLTHIIAIFHKEINRGRLPKKEQTKQTERGEKVLARFYELTEDYFLPDDKIEIDMKSEGVMIGEAHITGKLDFLRLANGSYEVLDFKTGKVFHSWDEARTDVDKIKLHNYRLQLIVYKLLLENSINFKDTPVAKNALLFTEEDPLAELALDATDVEIERAKKLIEAVYKKIITLDFPDISAYPKTYTGVLQFEEDLIEGTK